MGPWVLARIHVVGVIGRDLFAVVDQALNYLNTLHKRVVLVAHFVFP